MYELKFDYLQMNDVMKIIKDQHLQILHQNFELNGELSFSVRKSNSTKMYDMFSKISNLEIEFIKEI